MKKGSISDRTLLLGYASLFIVVSIFLLLRLSPEFYSFFNFLPLLIIGLLTPISITFSSFVISSVLISFILASKFSEYFFNSTYIIFLNFVICLIFLYLLDKSKKISVNIWGNTLSYFTLIISIISIPIFLFLLSDNITASIENFKKPYVDYFQQKNPENSKSLNDIFNFALIIFPSLNLITQLFLVIGNFFLAYVILKKMKFKIKTIEKLNRIELPNWYFFSFFIFLISCFFTKNNAFEIFINLAFIFGSLFFIKGMCIFTSFVEKIKIHVALKFLIIFLLFIFLGYVLILILFFIGIYDKFKKILT